ncbi:hypothetical protein PLESTB_000494100 [Pleodorina starrii]|uniref:Uncharacterized protein n=1 Tax=Pleodorina starrii TaxID=330485 RepID=A0A9W6F0Q3_9CHLO|nr:hypothetical protein PLESTM_000365600 [Pleodorina starrii]GLC51361.1 hypothetical protein PLESTB_000494100 [Pleodorina starrii]GLC63726.1 hypothetical protein PLESTF_000067600 [Pleodorina starrii]
MTHSTTCRVSPQASPGTFSVSIKPSQQLSCLDDNDGVVRVISNGRIQCPYPAAKAWVSDAVPPPGPGPSDDLSVPATATWVYRQRRDFGDEGETSALLAWLATLLCMPRLGSGRLRPPASRENSADSVDFVSTWQKAQSEAAARRVVPVLKRASELTPPAPNSPEPSLSGRVTPPLVRGPTSVHGSLTFPRPDSRPVDGNGRSHSYAPSAQRPPSCQLPPVRAPPSGDLVQYMADSLELPQPSSSRASTGSRPDSCQAASSGGQMSRRSVRFG